MIRKLVVIFGSVLGTLVFFVGVISIMGAMRPEVETKEAPPVAPIAFVKAVEYAPMNLSVKAQGEVAPRREITLASQISGRIDRVSDSFANGGVFKKDDILIWIEDADYRLAVTRAEAEVASARQRLAVEQAESDLAAQDYEELSGGNVGDAASVLTLRKPQLAAAEASLAGAQASLGDAKLALKRTKIVAPFNGRVRNIGADVGQFISPGASLGQIFATDVAEIRLPLTDSDLAKLNLPFAFEAEGDDAPAVLLSATVAGQLRQWKGRIRRIDAAIDSSTRQISAIAEVEEPYGKGADNGFPLAFGLFVEAEIMGPSIPRATVIPWLAMRDDGQVYIVDDEDKLALARPVIVAEAGEGLIAIDGIDVGALLVVSPVTSAVGTPVRPLFENGDSASTLVNLSGNKTETADVGSASVEGAAL